MPADPTSAKPHPSREPGQEHKTGFGRVIISKATPLNPEQLEAARALRGV